LINEIKAFTKDESIEMWRLVEPALLKAIAPKPVSSKLLENISPKSPMSTSSLFTGSQREPLVYQFM